MRPVARVTLAMLSRCRPVTTCSKWNTFRAGIISVSTMAKPLKMAPATK